MNRDHEKHDRTMQQSSGELTVLEYRSSKTVQEKPGQPSDTTIHKTLRFERTFVQDGISNDSNCDRFQEEN